MTTMWSFGGVGIKGNELSKGSTHILSDLWRRTISNEFGTLDRIMLGRIQVGKNASVSGEKMPIGRVAAIIPLKSSAPRVAPPSQFFRSMIGPDTAAENKIRQEWKKAA